LSGTTDREGARMSRDDDVVKLCQSVLGASLDMYDDPNGGFVYTCCLCGKSIELSGDKGMCISAFPHRVDCGYLIAKDLMTGINPRGI